MCLSMGLLGFGRRRWLPVCLGFMCLISVAGTAVAEPWIHSRDALIRVDIERLSRAGIIGVPIKTWPLMWSGIVNDLEAADPSQLPRALSHSFARVLAAGRQAARPDLGHHSLRLAAATQAQLFRHFGDSPRDKAQLTVRRHGMSTHFAYNLEISAVHNPWDGDSHHYDNSYFAAVWGNWTAIFGTIEKWWGPGWSSSLILANNARPTTGITLQRNYSDAFAWPLLKWLGPWTTSAFISQLDDQRHIDQAKLVGMTVGLRPLSSVEINLRRTAQWGGEGRPQGFKSFIELVTGMADNCDTALCRLDEPGNQLGGIDISWHIPWVSGSAYAQLIGEDEAGGAPSRSSLQFGFQHPVASSVFDGLFFIEHDNTTTLTHTDHYNILYNHSIYQSGYRYGGRAIGATWDNDSKITSLGILGTLSNGDSLEARLSKGDLNIDSMGLASSASKHSIATRGSAFNSFSATWRREFFWGNTQLEGRYIDGLIDEFGRQKDKLRFSASVTYRFD